MLDISFQTWAADDCKWSGKHRIGFLRNSSWRSSCCQQNHFQNWILGCNWWAWYVNLTKSEPDYSTENLKELEWRALPTESLLLNCSQQLMMRICLKLDIAVNTSMCSWAEKCLFSRDCEHTDGLEKMLYLKWWSTLGVLLVSPSGVAFYALTKPLPMWASVSLISTPKVFGVGKLWWTHQMLVLILEIP